ncbi:hypothetical protein [Ruania zhangjianzhongii]|uniref:hypothetical protein n=1 Tax=Ruania zhangjianzhongii TaxID=2603206 RepID=UPI0011C93A1F|nr:hypothetical protein [Ruania zhangjianzhongii]
MRTSRTGRPTLPRLLLPPWAYPLVGIGATLIGLLPWFRGGLQLPLQNLWATPTLPGDMPLVLVPLNQYYLDTILGLFVTAGVVGGVVARAAPPAHRALSGGLTAAGAFLAFAFACVQSALVLAEGLAEQDDRSSTYLVLVVAWAAASGLAGLLVLILLARAPRAGATVAMAIAAPAVGSWAQTLLAPSIALASPAAQTAVGYLHWLPAVLVGVALAWCGVRTSGRIGAWVMSLVLLWVVPAVLTVIGYLAGFRASGGVMESLGSGLDLLGLLLAPDIAGPPVLLALAIGVLGSVSIWIVLRIRARRADRWARGTIDENEETARDHQ